MKKRRVLITGASRGIGLAIKEELKRNYAVIAPSRDELDLSDAASIDIYITKLRDTPVDILINNAGINNPEWIGGMSRKNITDTIQVNLTAPLLITRAVVPHMQKQKWGRIVNVSSIFGLVARAKQVLYTATKHGINGMTKALALELAPYNILVNSVCPGFTDTDLVRRNPPQKIRQLEQDIPLGRLCTPVEVARLVHFLISDRNTYITGQSISIDGGFTSK